MTVLVACLVYAAATTAIAPVLLSRARWQVWHPRTALLAWHAAAASSSIALLVAVVLALRRLADVDPSRSGAGIGLLATWGGLFVVGCVGARALARLDPVLRGDLSTRESLEDALAGSGCSRECLESLEVHTVTSHITFALSGRAPGPTVVVSTSLRELLTELEIESVIAHETAHLHQRHHLAVFVAVAQRAIAPWFRPARQLEQATRLLIELSADDAAVRQLGPEAVVGALTKMVDGAAGSTTLMRATRARSR